ncbi:MAG: T9SS type A sorting domain-containing protein, partial [Chitinophagales bacterium]
VYPNPSNGTIYVDCSNINSNDNNIFILDITGKQIYSSQLTAQVINKIDISSIPNGLYIAQIANGNGGVDLIKIVKE